MSRYQWKYVGSSPSANPRIEIHQNDEEAKNPFGDVDEEEDPITDADDYVMARSHCSTLNTSDK